MCVVIRLSNFRLQFHLQRFGVFRAVPRAAIGTVLRRGIQDRLQTFRTFADHLRPAHDAVAQTF
jgi:hypothetical protein